MICRRLPSSMNSRFWFSRSTRSNSRNSAGDLPGATLAANSSFTSGSTCRLISFSVTV